MHQVVCKPDLNTLGRARGSVPAQRRAAETPAEGRHRLPRLRHHRQPRRQDAAARHPHPARGQTRTVSQPRRLPGGVARCSCPGRCWGGIVRLVRDSHCSQHSCRRPCGACPKFVRHFLWHCAPHDLPLNRRRGYKPLRQQLFRTTTVFRARVSIGLLAERIWPHRTQVPAGARLWR